MAVIKISRTVALDAPILTEALHGTLFTTEGQAHEFTIHCTQGGAAVTLSGTVTAKFIREETGDTILCAGSLSAGAAVVTLPADCYHRSGRFSMTIFCTSGSVATVVYACTGTVKAAEDGTLIDQGGVVPSIDQILQQLAGKVNKSGDTMTGALLIKQDSNYPTLGLVRANGSRGVWIQPNVSGDARMSVLQYNADATHYEQYRFPALNNGLTSNPGYDILTSKAPVTVAQGGTGLSGTTSPTLTPGANVVITANNLARFGPMVALNFVITVNSDLATGATIATIGNIDDTTGGPIVYLCAFRLDGTFKTFIKAKNSKNIITNAAIPVGIWYVNACILV